MLGFWVGRTSWALLTVVGAFVIACASDTTTVDDEEKAPSLEPTSIPWPTPATFDCEPTVPNGATPPGENLSPLHHGNGQIWTQFWPGGIVVFEVRGPGSVDGRGALSMKWPLWRSVEGDIRIEGRRQNGSPEDFLEVGIPGGYERTGFQALGLTFSAQGCWDVTARVGADSLTFVVAVYVP
jgi:hypothetical protein